MQEDRETRDQSRNNLALEVLRKTGTLRLSAFGYSMLPTLYPGDILTIKRETLGAIQPGDIVLYARGGRFYIHRNLRSVQGAPEKALLTRGDSMLHADEPVVVTELLGKVVSIGDAGEARPVPPWTVWRRAAGLILAYSGRLRSLALRWHRPRAAATAEFVSGEGLR